MTYSPAFKWSLALLLVLTLGWKWAVSSMPGTTPSEDKAVERILTEFLSRNHFRVLESREYVFGMHLIVVDAPLCKMKVVLSSSRGWHRDLIKNLSAGADETFVVFGGKIYREQPIVRTIIDFLWSRLVSGWGFNAQPNPVITVAAEKNCDAQHLPWRDLT